MLFLPWRMVAVHVCVLMYSYLLQVTGKGPLGQFSIGTGVPLSQAGIGLIAFISFFLVAAVFEGNYGEEMNEDKSQY